MSGYWNVTVERGGALAEARQLTEDQVSFAVEAPEGQWIQFTYDGLRTQAGEPTPLYFEGGCWWYRGLPYSDVIISWVQP